MKGVIQDQRVVHEKRRRGMQTREEFKVDSCGERETIGICSRRNITNTRLERSQVRMMLDQVRMMQAQVDVVPVERWECLRVARKNTRNKIDLKSKEGNTKNATLRHSTFLTRIGASHACKAILDCSECGLAPLKGTMTIRIKRSCIMTLRLHVMQPRLKATSTDHPLHTLTAHPPFPRYKNRRHLITTTTWQNLTHRTQTT